MRVIRKRFGICWQDIKARRRELASRLYNAGVSVTSTKRYLRFRHLGLCCVDSAFDDKR